MQVESARLVSMLAPREHSATLIALSGNLGAGKTTFAQGIAQALGVEEQVTSPTFVIEKIYQLMGQKFTRLIHIDAYRLKDPHELEVLGWNELITDPTNLIVIEWPEHVAALLPPDATHVTLSGMDGSRTITYG